MSEYLPPSFSGHYSLSVHCAQWNGMPAVEGDIAHIFGGSPERCTGDDYAECAEHMLAKGWRISRRNRRAICPACITGTPRVPFSPAVAVVAARVVTALDRPNFPTDGICSHHGVHLRVDGRTLIRVGVYGTRLQVIVSTDNVKIAEITHRAYADAVARALNVYVVERWNGKNGHDSVSLIFDRQAPESLIVGINNYKFTLEDVFNPTPAEKARYASWREWYEAGLSS